MKVILSESQIKKLLYINEQIVQGPAGDPYEYKRMGNIYYTRKKGSTEWLKTSGKVSDAIRTKIFSKNSQTPPDWKRREAQPTDVLGPQGSQSYTKNVNSKQTIAKALVGDNNVLNPKASLLFDGDKLYWVVDGSITKSWDGISGLTFKNTPIKDWGKLLKRFTQSPDEFSKMKDAGPIPKGNYMVGPIERRKGDTTPVDAVTALFNKFIGKYDNTPTKDTLFQSQSEYSRIGWGNYRAPIIPKPGTNTYGRGDFYIHGGSFEGSHGCIDLTNEMDDFSKYYGTWLAATKKKGIPLVVNYKTEQENSIFSKLWQLTAQGGSRPTEKYIDNMKI